MASEKKSVEHAKLPTPAVVKVRKAVRVVVPVAILIALVAGVGSGTLCSVGYDAIAYICPLGALESIFGSGAVVVRVIIAIAAVVVIALLFGKAFCSWVCPVPPLSSLFSSAKQRHKDKVACADAAKHVGERLHECSSAGCAACGGCASKAIEVNADAAAEQSENSTKKKARKSKLDSRYFVLAGALGSAAICGFPVFCLICPIGLTFATAIAFYRLAGFNEPTLDLLIFPVILILELTLLRKWCHRFCPVGALLSLIAGFNKTTRPKADKSLCVRSDGTPCTICSGVCPEHIDPCDDLGDRPLSECTRCGKCIESCPYGALSFTKSNKRVEAKATATAVGEE